MISDVHRALERLLYELGLLPNEVDTRFEMPTKQWIDSLTRPTINLFLFGIQENTEKRETSMQTIRGNGKAERRMPPRRIDLYYMVSVLTTEIEDEHELLWRVLATLMRYQELPVDVLPESLQHLEPPITTRIGDKDESGGFLDIWSALGTPPHPALCYVVTAPLDLDVAIQAPLVLTRTTRYLHMGSQTAIETGIHIGGTVRDKDGQPLADVTVRLESSAADGSKTDLRGQFVLTGVPNGPATLSVMRRGKIPKQVKVSVPDGSYDIVLDE
jgi:hypothetical protein